VFSVQQQSLKKNHGGVAPSKFHKKSEDAIVQQFLRVQVVLEVAISMAAG